jgi:tetratricopeptide (TPR) repeat protein
MPSIPTTGMARRHLRGGAARLYAALLLAAIVSGCATSSRTAGFPEPLTVNAWVAAPGCDAADGPSSEDVAQVDPGRLQSAATALEAGRRDSALRDASEITYPLTLIAMRADRRFDSLRAQLPRMEDVSGATDAFIARERKNFECQPWSLELARRLLRAQIDLGRYEDALGFADSIIGIAAAEGADRYPDFATDLPFIVGARAKALQALGRWDEAVEQYRVAVLMPEGPYVNVSQRMDFAYTLIYAGLPREAQEQVEAAGRERNERGDIGVLFARIGIAEQLNDTAGLRQHLAEFERLTGPLRSVYRDALVVAGDLDGVTRILLAQLKDPVLRNEALYDAQVMAAAPGVGARDTEYARRWRSIIARSEVRAAIDAVGRVETYPMLSLKW